jgi:hypothetical protein
MTGRRETTSTRGCTLPATPTGTRLVVPDLHRCTPAYRLGRAIGQLIGGVAALLAPAPKTVGAVEL